jgi:hypothetical protein
LCAEDSGLISHELPMAEKTRSTAWLRRPTAPDWFPMFLRDSQDRWNDIDLGRREWNLCELRCHAWWLNSTGDGEWGSCIFGR